MSMITPMSEPAGAAPVVEALARLATEMFNAVPGGTPPGNVPVDAPWLAPEAIGSSRQIPVSAGFGAAPPSAPLPQVPPLSASLPGEAELLTLLGRLAPSPAAARAPATQSATSYYFLTDKQEARPNLPEAHPAFDVGAIRRDFPILNETVNGRKLIWLDNAATTQKPQAVIDRLSHFYQHENSNIHRGAHELAARATDAYEGARATVRGFLNAASVDEIVFVRGATEGINLIAQSWGRHNIGRDDEIVITWLEHHANIVPWQQLCAETGARLRVVPVDDNGQVRLDEYAKMLGPRTKLVAFTQVSNALGTVTPARQMIEMARRTDARVLIDGAQAVSHLRVDVQSLDCDWYVFSGHKVFGPTGIGVVYGKAAVLEAMAPWQGGGNMIRDVTFDKTEYQGGAAKFEAGTGNIADAVGLGAAIDYVRAIGMENIARHEHELLAHATRLLQAISGLRIIGTAAEKAGVLSFVLDGLKSENVGAALNREGIAVRSGHHCAQPILRRFGHEAIVRPSFAFYNTFGEIDALAAAVQRIRSGATLVG